MFADEEACCERYPYQCPQPNGAGSHWKKVAYHGSQKMNQRLNQVLSIAQAGFLRPAWGARSGVKKGLYPGVYPLNGLVLEQKMLQYSIKSLPDVQTRLRQTMLE